jgi:hypothetical protein
MQRLDSQADAAFAGVRQNGLNALCDHDSSAVKVAVRRRTIDQHKQICAERNRFINRSEVVLNPIAAFLDARGGKHSTTTQARYADARTSDQLTGRGRRFLNLVSPCPKPANPLMGAGLDSFFQSAGVG